MSHSISVVMCHNAMQEKNREREGEKSSLNMIYTEASRFNTMHYFTSSYNFKRLIERALNLP